MDDTTLLVDQRSASLAASEVDVRVWASGRRVFVSSLITDMPGERSAVRAAIEAVGATPVMFEDLGAQDVSAEHAYLSGVRSSEVYVGMWGPRYGVRMLDGYSATHAEFVEAERNGLRLCLFVHGETSARWTVLSATSSRAHAACTRPARGIARRISGSGCGGAWRSWRPRNWRLGCGSAERSSVRARSPTMAGRSRSLR